MDILGNSCEIGLRQVPIHDKSTLVQEEMAWCCQVISCYLAPMMAHIYGIYELRIRIATDRGSLSLKIN